MLHVPLGALRGSCGPRRRVPTGGREAFCSRPSNAPPSLPAGRAWRRPRATGQAKHQGEPFRPSRRWRAAPEACALEKPPRRTRTSSSPAVGLPLCKSAPPKGYTAAGEAAPHEHRGSRGRTTKPRCWAHGAPGLWRQRSSSLPKQSDPAEADAYAEGWPPRRGRAVPSPGLQFQPRRRLRSGPAPQAAHQGHQGAPRAPRSRRQRRPSWPPPRAPAWAPAFDGRHLDAPAWPAGPAPKPGPSRTVRSSGAAARLRRDDRHGARILHPVRSVRVFGLGPDGRRALAPRLGTAPARRPGTRGGALRGAEGAGRPRLIRGTCCGRRPARRAARRGRRLCWAAAGPPGGGRASEPPAAASPGPPKPTQGGQGPSRSRHLRCPCVGAAAARTGASPHQELRLRPSSSSWSSTWRTCSRPTSRRWRAGCSWSRRYGEGGRRARLVGGPSGRSPHARVPVPARGGEDCADVPPVNERVACYGVSFPGSKSIKALQLVKKHFERGKKT